MKRMLQHFGIVAGLAAAFAHNEQTRMPVSESTIRSKFFRIDGPGRNQRKRRALDRISNKYKSASTVRRAKRRAVK